MKQRVLPVLVALAMFAVPFQLKAWGLLGHRIVGQIAENHLTKKARMAIKGILGNESVAMAANYADFIKSDTSYKYVDSWHYINFDNGLSYQAMQAYLTIDTIADAYTKMVFLSNELRKKNLPQDKKVLYLKLLIHIAGDVHQPMHSTASGDRGGNDIKVQWFGQPSNLHRVWDSDFIEMQQLSYTEYAATLDYATAQEFVLLQSQPISKWLFDSYVISAGLRADITQPNQRLGYEYNFKYLATLNEQLRIGGLHLGGLLNDIFK